ncbi:DUF4369 domain-containing protein [Flavobacteriaceae bacterium]|nr:DUF4369 domain-containing protein [Flavobacteriaceae bacterium]
MRSIFTLFVSILIISCGSPTKKAMNVTGTIDGLRKGTLYLQKIEDTLLVNVDSIKVEKNKVF